MKKKTKKILFTIFMILNIALIIFLYLRGNSAQAASSVTSTTVSEEQVTTRTITNTLTGSRTDIICYYRELKFNDN